MALDLYSITYFNHQQMLVFKALTRQIRGIIAWYKHHHPEISGAINSIIDVLEGFYPIDAGSGRLSIEAAGIGELNIMVDDRVMYMEVAPFNPLTKDFGYPGIVFQVYARELTAFSLEGLAFALRILRYVNYRQKRYREVAVIWAAWEQNLDHIPSGEWVALREAAIKAGHEPPRACHWMARQQ